MFLFQKEPKTEVTQKAHTGIGNKIQVHLTPKSGNEQDQLICCEIITLLGGEFPGWKGGGPPQGGLRDEV